MPRLRYSSLRHTKEYSCWLHMLSRCESEKDKDYPNYGGRGIKVCRKWHSFLLFLEDMGICPPGYSIERNNVDGNYEPSNCEWASDETQRNNKRNTHWVTWNSERKSLKQWCDIYGMNYSRTHRRITSFGWSFSRCLMSDMAAGDLVKNDREEIPEK